MRAAIRGSVVISIWWLSSAESELPRLERNRDWPCERLPVPTDLLVYTIEEWERMRRRGGRFARHDGRRGRVGGGRGSVIGGQAGAITGYRAPRTAAVWPASAP